MGWVPPTSCRRFSWSWEVFFFFACQDVLDASPPSSHFQKRCYVPAWLWRWGTRINCGFQLCKINVNCIIARWRTVTKAKRCYEWLIIPNNPHIFLNVDSNINQLRLQSQSIKIEHDLFLMWDKNTKIRLNR